MGFWLSYAGHRVRRPRDPLLRRLAAPCSSRGPWCSPRCCFPPRLGWLRLDAPLALWPVLPGCSRCVAVLIMIAGYPEGTPLRHGLTFAYNRFASLRFLRASYKAGPLLPRARVPGRRAGGRGLAALAAARRRLAGGAPLAVAAAAILTARLLAARHRPSPGRQNSWKRIPAAWRAAARGSIATCRATPARSCCPATCSPSTAGAGPSDPLLTALTPRTVAVRTEVPYADLHATDLLLTIDDLVHQRRLLPGELAPLLSLIGARAGHEHRRRPRPQRRAAPGRRRPPSSPPSPACPTPTAPTGQSALRAAATLAAPRRLPDVRRTDLAAAPRPSCTSSRAAPRWSSTARPRDSPRWPRSAPCPRHRAVRYAGDLTPARMRRRRGRGRERRDQRLQPAPRVRPRRASSRTPGPTLSAADA